MLSKEDIEFYTEQFKSLKLTYGIGATILIVILIIVLYFGYSYLTKRIDKIVEEASEKTLKKYQAEIDKDNFKYEIMHQNQIDAIHNVYKEFNDLNIAINYLLNGENFSSPPNARQLISHIIDLRHKFKKEFLKNKLLFSKELGNKIEYLVPEVDKFIEKFNAGLFPEMSDEQNNLNAEMNNGFIITGLWSSNTFGPLLDSMSSIILDIEDEFRKIVGTN